MGERIVLGTTSISVTNEEFSKGYQEGYLHFIAHNQGNPLTDVDVYSFLIRTTLDIVTSDCHRAGYIMGWSAALHGQICSGTPVSCYITNTQQQVEVTV